MSKVQATMCDICDKMMTEPDWYVVFDMEGKEIAHYHPVCLKYVLKTLKVLGIEYNYREVEQEVRLFNHKNE